MLDKDDKVATPVLTSVPDVGRVTLVAPVVVNVKALAPEVVKFPPSVIVLAPLFIPVPPFAEGKIPVTSVVRLKALNDGFTPPCNTCVEVPAVACASDPLAFV